MSQRVARKIRNQTMPAPAPADFVHDNLPGRVVFGAGASEEHLLPELDRLEVQSVLTLAAPSHVGTANRIGALLGERNVGVVHLPHAPSGPGDPAEGVDHVRKTGANGLVVIGGGSAISRAKAVAAIAAIPLLAIPTTYSGAELSPSYETCGDGHRSSSPDALPGAVIYDPRLTFTLTPELTGSSAMSALANGVEALCCTNGSPVSALIAEEGIRHIAEGARDSVLHPDGLLGRSLTQFGAYLTGAAAAVTVPGLLQTAAEAVGHFSGVSYADARAVLVPHYLAAQRDDRPLVLAVIAAALGRNDAVDGLHEFAQDVGAPRCLADLGVTDDQIDLSSEHCRKHSSYSPHDTVAQALPSILKAALTGA